MATDNNSNSGDAATGAQTASVGINSAQVQEAAQQLQTSVSRFVQEDQRKDENLSRLMDTPSDEIRRLEQKIEDVRRATERNLDMIHNYRS